MEFSYPPIFLDQVDAIIEKNLPDETFSVEMLSQHLLLSHSQVYRKIKQKTGITPSSYIRNKRLQFAKELIECSELRITEVADAVGFSCLSYFSSSFTQRYGYPPSHLRP